jgi:glucose-1-phosphate adenylyltransferase
LLDRSAGTLIAFSTLIMDNDCLAMILGGGRGSRLFPLTQQRSKPAVPIGGKHRLIDIPISNCLNSGLRRMFVLTQYNSESLNNHISQTYKFDIFSEAFITILAAEQTEDNADWFQGTADAVRRTMRHLERWPRSDVLLLSGDQLFQMDLRSLCEAHYRSNADVTLAVIPVAREQTSGFGILKVDSKGRIVHFEEKPGAERLDDLESDIPGFGRGFLASMGIYLFGREALAKAIADPALLDFGRQVIPSVIEAGRVQAYVFRGYWEDVGTVQSYYEASLDLTRPDPPFDFYDARGPIYSRPGFLPASRIQACTVGSSLISDGSIIEEARIERTIVGIRSRVGARSRLRDTLVLGADYYETEEEMKEARRLNLPPVGIGAETQIERAIIDKNARIGRGVRITSKAEEPDRDGDGYHIRSGIVIVGKNGVLRDGTVV